MLNKWRQRLTANQGYTIDQTILIVAIIAILITLIIITIGWQLIGRSNGTKLAAQVRQIEDANGTFYSDQKMWPDQALATGSDSPTNNIRVLMNQITGLAFETGVDTTTFTNQLPGLKGTTSPVHTIGSAGPGALVTEQVNTASAWGLGANKFMVVQFAAVPSTEAKEADEAIDGAAGYNTGRLVYSKSACLNATNGGIAPAIAASTGGSVYVCYAANAVQ